MRLSTEKSCRRSEWLYFSEECILQRETNVLADIAEPCTPVSFAMFEICADMLDTNPPAMYEKKTSG